MSDRLIIKNATQLVTCSGFEAKRGAAMADLGIIEDGALVAEEGVIRAVGSTERILDGVDMRDCTVIDASGKAVLPGFVDSHTHFPFAGYRLEEYGWRLSGMLYMEIMEKGGGIVRTMSATREAGRDELIGQPIPGQTVVER